MKRFIAIAAALMISAGAPAAAANLVIDGSGELAGATGIDIGGTFYDVEFVDGTCIGVFSGCDSLSDFAFQTQEAANAAGQALFDQVFLGIYDDQPELTAGCNDPEFCTAAIPYALQVSPAVVSFVPASNGAPGFPDNSGTGGAIVTFDTTGVDTVWARFTLSAVPEPSTWMMMLLGFGAIGARMRRRVQAGRLLATT